MDAKREGAQMAQDEKGQEYVTDVSRIEFHVSSWTHGRHCLMACDDDDSSPRNGQGCLGKRQDWGAN